jgi:hypothetical protein
MSDAGKPDAQASVSETVAETTPETKAEATQEVAETEVKTAEAKDEATEAPVEGAEVVETEEEKKTKSQLRAERRRAHIAALEAEVKRLSEVAAAAERNKPATDAIGEKPDRAKYDDEAEYTADLAAYKVREQFLAAQSKAHETNTTTVRNDSTAKRMELFKERAMALADRYPDIEAKVFNDTTLPMSATMAETIMDSEKGPEIAYHLSANRELAQRIKSMSPLQAAMELGRIEANLSLPKPRTQTQAPPPPTTLSGTARSPNKNPENMSQAEYVKWRSNGGGEKRTG